MRPKAKPSLPKSPPQGQIRTVLLGIFVLLAWIFVAGKDMSWDVFNHHYYIPFAWLSGRIDTDFFGAGPQSYQNPLGYIPFYLLVHANLPAWAVGLGLGLLHALIVFPLAAIIGRLWSDEDREKQALGWHAAAMLAAICTPVLLITAGTSSADPISAVLVIIALALQVCDRGRSPWLPAWVGFLLAMALAVKLSNAVFVVASAVLALWRCGSGRARWATLLGNLAGGLSGLLAGMGWYCWKLWSTFGNPVFPFYNNVFRSPFASSSALSAQRFLPEGLAGWLVRPWEMMATKTFVYHESFVPDTRPFLLCTLLAGGLAYGALRRGNFRDVLARFNSTDRDILLYCGIAYTVWMATTGNGRYAIALLVLLAVMSVRVAYLLFPTSVARIITALALVAQAWHFHVAGDSRMSPAPWTDRPFFDLSIPAELRDRPYLHLTYSGTQTYASIAARFHPDGALVNPVGQISLPSDGVIGDRVQTMLEQWQGRTRVLFSEFRQTPEHAKKVRVVRDVMFARFGVKIRWDDCMTIGYTNATVPDNSIYWWFHDRSQPERKHGWVSCGVVRTPRAVPSIDDRRADRVFSILENRCPELFGPPPLVSEKGPGGWERMYANSDTIVVVSTIQGVTALDARSLDMRYIGTIKSVLEGRVQPQCTPWKWSLN